MPSRSGFSLLRLAGKARVYFRRYIVFALFLSVALTAALERGCQG